MPAWVDDFSVAVASGLVVALLGFIAAQIWGRLAHKGGGGSASADVSAVPAGLPAEPPVNPAEQQLWEEIQHSPSREREEFYLRTFPGGRHAAAVEAKLWALAEADGDIASYRRFVDVAPKGTHGAVAALRLEQLEKTRLLRTFDTGAGPDVWAVALSPDGALAAGTAGESVVIWDTATGHEVRRFGETRPDRHPSASLAFSPDGSALFWWNSLGKRIEVRDIGTGEVRQSISTAEREIRAVVFSRDGRRALGFGCHEAHHYWERCVKGALAIWQLSSGAARSWTRHADSVISADFLGAFDRVVSVSAGKPHVAIAEPGEAPTQQLPHMGGHAVSSFSDESIFALACETEDDGLGTTRRSVIKLFRFEPLKLLTELGELGNYPGYIRDLAVSDDGRLIAAAGDAGIVRIWSVPGRREVATLDGHQSYALSVRISHDGRRALSGGTDGKVRLWDLTGL